MKLLDKKYYNLQPELSNITDPYILGLAWKKTDSFIRTHNWYADLLALDKYALNIEAAVNHWSNNLKSKAIVNTKIELILAPKSAQWSIHNGKWIQKKSDRKLRPLANLSIKDQSLATIITMCLADALESRQKDCSLVGENYSEHIKNKVFNYGNRLLCDWEDDKARFRWGGSEFYRKFSNDFRVFVQRPISIGREIRQKVSAVDNVYIVNLDFANFYGSIKPCLLLKKLQAIASEHYKKQYVVDDGFWSVAQDVFNWTWSDDSLEVLKQLELQVYEGVPQGLASAGALSNAYLIDFDEAVSTKLRNKIENSSIVVHDYCRYVDDIRLVISGESLKNEEIKDTIHAFIQEIIDGSFPQDDSKDSLDEQCLKINESKTLVFDLSDIDNWSSLTNRVNEIQTAVAASSVPERNGLDANIPVLQQLLTEEDDFFESSNNLFPGFNTDKAIKVESLRRFSANRLQSSMFQKSKLISPAERTLFESESMLIAKKLIKAWLKDPSIMVIFRKALEINPSIDIYSKILSIIFKRVISNRDKHDRYIMIYLLSDIFRSIADIYRKLDADRLASYKKLISETTAIAQNLLSCKATLPSYLYHQALFYLAVVNKPHINTDKSTIELAKLHNVLIKQHFEAIKLSDGYLFEIAAQMSDDHQGNAAFLLSHSNKRKVVDSILRTFAFRGGEFWNAIWNELLRTKDQVRIDKYRWAIPLAISKPNSSEHYLSSIINFKDNPFQYEHSLLKLGIELTNLLEDEKTGAWHASGNQISPHEIKVLLQNNKPWHELWQSDAKILCSADRKDDTSNDPRYKTPGWLSKHQPESCSEQKIYWICSVLRGAALGKVDYTQRNDLKFDLSKYNGIRTQWYKRRMGMLHTPESIVGSYSTISDWFASLLQHGLQWPGFSSSYLEEKDILAIDSLADFRRCLRDRLDYLNDNICVASNVPSLSTIVKRPDLVNNHFRIVTVQQLFPKDKHFHFSDVTLDNPEIRWKHREHLSEICKLTEQTLSAKLRTETREHKSTADLIVFSELAVHPDDEDVIRALAFRTKSIIFAGFVFTEHDGQVVNKARWIIPDNTESGIQWRVRDQGKYHMTADEVSLGVKGYRPCQHIIEIEGHPEGPFKLTGAICYDATDIKLISDLRDKTDMFVIAAYNKDVNTFDNMASALQWHMYQHIVIANTGEYGGSTMQAPYKEKHHKLLSHAHGSSQIAISTADIDLAAFTRKVKEYKKTKRQPAGFNRK
jgi:hypothetical protein